MSGAGSFRGLWTNPDDLNAPDGALAVADNVTFYQPGILEPFRGMELLSLTSIGGTINRTHEYQGTLIAHYGTASIARWTGSWTTYSGTFNPPDSSTPVTFFEGAGSLFVLTAAGVYELDSPAGTWRLTGSPLALQGTATLRRTSNELGSVAPANGQWAYRLVWGYKNANRHLQLGAPSGRFTVAAPANLLAGTGAISKPNASSTVTVINLQHGFATGEYVDVTLGGAETWFAPGRFQVTVVSSTSFTYSDSVNNTSGVTKNPANSITYGFTSRNVDVVAPIPAGITTSHFLQVYRSAQSADANAEPSDNLALVYERPPTNLEVAAGSMTVTDIAPDALRGAELYTSVGTLLDAKAQPPAALGACLFKGAAFYVNTAAPEQLVLQLLAVGGDHGLQVGATLTFNDNPTIPSLPTWVLNLTPYTDENAAGHRFKLYTDGTAAQNVANTAKSLVRVINAQASAHISAEYASSDTEAPGRVRIFARTLDVNSFMAFFDGSFEQISPFALSPVLPYLINVATIGRSGSTVTVNTGSSHGFLAGQVVLFDDTENASHFPNGLKTIVSVPSGTSFTYTEAGPAVALEANFGSFFSYPPDTFRSTNQSVASAFMWSEPGEPWAVPSVNFKDIGKGAILACVATRDRVLLETDDGFYQVTGDGANWSLSEFDTTLKLQARRASASAGGRVYALTDQGVVEAMESARVVSLPVDKDFRELLASALSTVQARAFMVPYEQARQLWLFLPAAAGDTAAQRAYVYNLDTGEWTRRVLNPTNPFGGATPGPVAQDAFVSPTDGKLYVASGGYVVKERKTLSGAADQLDPVIPGTVWESVVDVNPGGGTVLLEALGADIGNYYPVGSTLYNATLGDTATVTAVDVNASVVTVTGGALSFWSLGDTVYPTVQPVSSIVEPVAQTEGSPGAQKVFAEGSLAFRDSHFTSASLQFATDLAPNLSAASTLAPPGGSTPEPTEIDFWVPQPWRRGTRLRMRFVHSTSLERYALQSFTLRARLCSRRTTR